MPVHPLWRPFEQRKADEGKRPRPGPVLSSLPGRIEVVPPDPAWPTEYETLATRIRAALGPLVVGLQHIGSTAVPGTYAKPAIDIDLTVPDAANEDAYLPALTDTGFILVAREPDREQHRCLVCTTPRCYLHVFSEGAIEPQRHRAFRDWLITHEADRARYELLKRSLSTREWDSMADYNNAKAALVYEIYERIFAADPVYPHDPQPLPAALTEG